MKVDCSWFNAHLESFSCETLDPEEFQLASEHLRTCLSCRNEVQALQEMDPLIKQVFKYRVSVAQAAGRAPRRSLGFQLGLAGTTLAVAALLMFAVFIHPASEPKDTGASSSAVKQEPSPLDSKGITDVKGDTGPTERAKPDAPVLKSSPGKNSPEPVIPDGAPEFLVIDTEGHSWSLPDYRGRVVFIGVWSVDQPDAAQNLQRVYQALGTRRESKILGVSSRKLERPAGTTFPMVFNDGSRLLETQNSNFVIVDKEGNVQMHGSLLGNPNALVAKVKARMDELGAR